VEHYHVAVSSDIPGLKSSIEFNLTKEEAKGQIVERYNKFEEFECEERKFHPAYVTQLLIYKTTENIKDLKPAKEPAVTNSEKWNYVVLQHGILVNKELNVNKYDLVQLEKFKIAKKYMITNSVDTMNDFSKVMISLVSGFFAVYFALIKLLNLQTMVIFCFRDIWTRENAMLIINIK
jgi:hypothetical protein